MGSCQRKRFQSLCFHPLFVKNLIYSGKEARTLEKFKEVPHLCISDTFHRIHRKTLGSFHLSRSLQEKQVKKFDEILNYPKTSIGRWIGLSYMLDGLHHISSPGFAFHLDLFLSCFYNLVGWHDLDSQSACAWINLTVVSG